MTSRSRLRTAVSRDFDGVGIRKTFCAVVTSAYQTYPHWTLAQYLVQLEALVAEDDGNPHTVGSLAKKLGMPYSTVSRIVWSLTETGGEDGILRYEPHPTDRRKKYVRINPARYSATRARVMMKAMREYYGDSVRKLKRRAS